MNLIDVSAAICQEHETQFHVSCSRRFGRVLPEDKPCSEPTDLSDLAQAQCDKQFVLRLLALGSSSVCLSAAHE